MPIKRPPLVNGEIYHIVIRAVEELTLFRQEKDYLRFLNNLFEFNDENPTISSYRQNYENCSRSGIIIKKEKRKILVEILAFCLMPNHIHILLKQMEDNGISRFMRKVGAGYGMYYNKRYNRKGHVFDGRFRAVLIKNNEQLRTIFVYIHTNPVALLVPKWKEEGIKTNNLENIIDFIESYKWSSYQKHLGNNNYSWLIKKDSINSLIKKPEEQRYLVREWLSLKKQMASRTVLDN